MCFFARKLVHLCIFPLLVSCGEDWESSSSKDATQKSLSEDEREYTSLYEAYKTRMSFEDYAELKLLARDLTKDYYTVCRDGLALQRYNPVVTSPYWRLISFDNDIAFLARGGKKAYKAEALNGMEVADARILIYFKPEVATLTYRELTEEMVWKDDPTGYAIHIKVEKRAGGWAVTDENHLPVSPSDCNSLPPLNI